MPLLSDYDAFEGIHWETGTVHNYYAYRGVIAPHTQRPYSEALLLGVSGGIVMGYFSFAYEGFDPQARILTRNTFDPLDTMLSRLGVAQNIHQTNRPEKAVKNLLNTLEEGVPAIVWVDGCSLPYTSFNFVYEGMWWMYPVVVYGYDEAADRAWLADFARVPQMVSTGELNMARARVKQTKFRLLTLEAPDPDKLRAAVQKGIWDCIKLFTEAPPKGSKNNFGFAAYRWWVELLTRPKARLSWEREYPAGRKMYAGLLSAFNDIRLFGKMNNADREMYADFLDEASLILNRPGLQEAAGQFRRSGMAWGELSVALLPDDVPLFAEARQGLLRKHHLLREQGAAALEEVRVIDRRLGEIKEEISADFPLDEAQTVAFRQRLADHVLRIHDIEQEAVLALQVAMSNGR
jgi:hypothetical protein